jgi:DNA uptake protein ComE-like DNA-binding protein
MEAFKNYFYYTKSERRGAVLLLSICVIGMVAPHLIRRDSEFSNLDTKDTEVIAEILENLQSPKEQTGKNAANGGASFFFNPNTASLDTLILLGLPERTAKSLVNYRSKGGKFNKPEDLQKIYTLSAEDYQRLRPWVKISEKPKSRKATASNFELRPFDPNTATQDVLLSMGLSPNAVKGIIGYRNKGGKFRKPEDLKQIYSLEEVEFNRVMAFIQIEGKDSVRVDQVEGKFSFKARKEVRVDINRADTETWQSLRGIGPGYAGKICRFREALGGFTSIQQVAETKGLPDSTFQAIIPFLEFSPPFRLLKINTSTVEELAAHPYLDYREASALAAYRYQHGKFESALDVAKVLGLKPGTMEKLEPYLDFR